MRIGEIFHIVYINMIENKFRLLLTTLGIIVGTITIILVIAIGKGGEMEAAKQFSNLSADTIYINLDYSALGKKNDVSTVEKLTPDLVDKIIEESTTLQGLYLRVSSYKEVKYKTTKQSTNLVGVTQGYAEISNILIEHGSDFSEYDFEDGERVAVIGSKIAEKIFANEDVVGNYIKIDDFRYKIVGIIKRSEDGLQGVDTDSSLFIPYSTMQKDNLIDKYATTQAVGKAFSINEIEKVKKEIKSTLNYYMDNFSVYTVSDAGTRIEAATASATTMKLLLISVAIIVFVVGGIGIMNVMFVTVKERTKEIGILKGLGAKEKDILFQFLLESFCIGLFSGIIGVILSFFVINIMKYTEIPVYQTFDGKLIAALFAVSTSTIFGFYPAYKASKLMPVKALAEE
ncbi:ABC transporter permease [Clostridium sp. VAP41]|uniref:ABC transporter permease n=1 Tax=Clostridium sp. VAP41 TaxID=2949979 RepID=UPI00207A7EED|nr:ABC transporter permease [Clostridium sp. VAP41]